ncbi:hypothetical protein GGI04_002293 [Coemansia thaxteri]|nr:hypothetical protein GGI04_002293 [Coemansia thaxteri]
MASTLPSECLLLVLAWLWDDDYELATRFFDRSSHCCAAYDQTRIHNVLRARSLAPLHVSRAWRQCAVPRFFRLAFIDLTTAATCELPPWVLPYVGRLFLALPSPAHPTSSSPGGYTEAACRLKRVLAAPLQHARVLGLCFAADSQGSVASGSPDPNILGRLLAHRMPCLERIWVQCSGALTRPAHVLINELQTSTPDSTPLSAHRHPRVTAIHLAASSRRNALAIDLIHMCASKLEFLCLGKVSGGVLGEITHATTHQPSGQTVIKLVIFPALKRLLFTVDANAHIYASLPDYRFA